MLIYRSFTAVCIYDDLIEEVFVAAFADILDDSREQPECVVSTVRGVTCLLNIFRIVGSVFVTGIVVELNKRQTAAVVNLSGEHETNLLSSHFRIKVNDTLNVLNGITVAVAVSQTTVNE